MTKQTNKQSTHPYRIPMSLFVLCAVAAVAERLVAVVVSRELAKERLLPGVRPANYILEDDKTLLLGGVFKAIYDSLCNNFFNCCSPIVNLQVLKAGKRPVATSFLKIIVLISWWQKKVTLLSF